jgi:hypothetical protein
VIAEAAARWRVPVWALVGVKLAETGNDPNAANPFQFEPGTAKSAGVRDVNNLHESADGAAKLLAGYKRQFGSWNAAFEAYNGGPGAVGGGYAYDEAHIKSKLAEYGVSQLASTRRNVSLGSQAQQWAEGYGDMLEKLFIPHSPQIPSSPGNPALEANPLVPQSPLSGGAGSLLSFPNIEAFFNLLRTGQLWIRLAEIIAGAVLAYLALKELTGTGFSDLPGARVARTAVKL